LHLVLATHRPAAVTDTGLGAIAQLRVALHVSDDFESIGVIGRPDAALLSRRVPGRGYLQIDDQRPILMQVATSAGVAHADAGRTTVRPFVVHRAPTLLEQHLLDDEDRLAGTARRTQTDLARLVAAIDLAADAVGYAALSAPYIDPLPAAIELADLLAEHPGDGVPFGVVDLPEEHRRAVRWWQPGPTGSMLVYGATRAAPSSLLATLVIGAAERCSPDDVHLYVIAANSSGLVTLDALPHVGAVARPDDLERVAALVRLVHAEVTVRRAVAGGIGDAHPVLASEPAVALIIDGIGDLSAGLVDLVAEIVIEGPGVGVCSVITACAASDVPQGIADAITERWVMGPDGEQLLADLGIRADDVGEMPPGRALSIDDRLEMQVARAAMPLAATVREIASVSTAISRPPRGVDRTPIGGSLAEVLVHARYGAGRLVAPVGIDLRDGSPALLALDHGTAALVLGPPGSGRSTVLDAIVRAARAADPDLPVFHLSVSDADAIAERVDRVLTGRGPRLLLIDDADLLADASLVELGKAVDDDLTIVLAGQVTGITAAHHWARPLVHTRTGVLLRPTPGDGTALHVQLDAAMYTPAGPGRGVLVNDGVVGPLQTLR
jgi:S-DNA-T family DNA segregation ATPase FtsK/SpoIIIE